MLGWERVLSLWSIQTSVMGNANAGAGWEERKVVKGKPPINV